MKIYVAAPWQHKQDAIDAAKILDSEGFEVISRWFHHEDDSGDNTGINLDIDEARYQARQDINDVLGADFIVVLNLAISEGKAVETGIAIANHIPVISVGQRSNIFQSLGHEVATLQEAIAILSPFLKKVEND